MSQQRLLPIKVVFPSKIDYQAPQGGGGEPTFFGDFNDELRKNFDMQVDAVRQYFSASFRTWGELPAIVKVRMKREALAKSHRPDELFNQTTCPVAVRAITVSSRAHNDNAGTRVKREEPSPFSRRGPGPAYLIKPELSHYGGNCDATGACAQSGIISVDGAGHIAEDIGTSFACPSISAIAGHVEHQLRNPSAVPSSLVKALLIHSALLRNPNLDSDLIKYQGIGIPGDADSIITCSQSEATLILQIPVQARPEFGKRPFPMPQSLNGPKGLNGEIFMTLLYDPPLDRGFGFEYCRTNVNASLGTVGINTDGEETYNREVPPVPKQLTDAYEDDLIKHGYKWSPLKLYYRRFKRGPTEKPWRLTLELLNRAEYVETTPQDIVLIITIRDPKGEAAIYDEIVQAMKQLNWNTQDLQVRIRAQQ